MKFIALLNLLLILLFARGLNAADETPKISVKAEINKAFITIGDPIEYTVLIEHEPDVQILSQIPPPPDDVLKIKKVRDIRKDEDGLIFTGKKFTLTTYKLGQFILDPIEIQFRYKNQEPQSISTDPIYIQVKSVAEGEEKVDIRGLKPVVPIRFKWSRWLLAPVLIVLGAAFVVWFYWLRRKKPNSIAVEAPRLSAEDEALMLLTKLFESDLIRRGKIKDYFLKLSEILKAYFERRYHILALESTTAEILRDLLKKDVSPELVQNISTVLEQSDLAKFAKWVPDPAQIVAINQMAKQVIEKAKAI